MFLGGVGSGQRKERVSFFWLFFVVEGSMASLPPHWLSFTSLPFPLLLFSLLFLGVLGCVVVFFVFFVFFVFLPYLPF